MLKLFINKTPPINPKIAEKIFSIHPDNSLAAIVTNKRRNISIVSPQIYEAKHNDQQLTLKNWASISMRLCWPI